MLWVRFRIFGLALVLCVGCFRGGSSMSTGDRWSTIAELRGWQVFRQPLDAGAAVTRAHLQRQPDHPGFQTDSRKRTLSSSELEEYDKLNEQLHEELRRLSHEMFDGLEVPSSFSKLRREESYFTPFTSQNYDWYGPSYEVYICVVNDAISSNVLAKFQSLLRGPYKDWCIVVVGVVGSDSEEVHDDHEIYLFSDEVITTVGDSIAIGVPEGQRLQVK